MSYPPAPGAPDPQDPYGAPRPGDGSGAQQDGSGSPAPGEPGYGNAPEGQTPYGAPAAYPGAPYGAAPSYPQGGYGAPGGYGGYFPKNNLAVWSLVLGILGFVLCGIFTAIPAVIVGSNAKKAVAAGEANNGGMATAGIVLGWVGIALSVLGTIALIALWPTVVADWERAFDV